MSDMVTKKTWQEFRETGMMWWVNVLLHTFGWAIVVNIDKKGKISEVYPARVKFRGFQEEINTEGYQLVTKFLVENQEELWKETQE